MYINLTNHNINSAQVPDFLNPLRNIALPASVAALSRLLGGLGSKSDLVWDGVRATTGKLQQRNCQLLSPKTLRMLGHRFLGFCSIIPGVARTVRPHLDY